MAHTHARVIMIGSGPADDTAATPLRQILCVLEQGVTDSYTTQNRTLLAA